MKIIQKFEQGKLIPRNKVDNTILKHIKRQGIVLPPSKNEQINADNRTKELKDYQNSQQQINKNLENGKYLNYWTQPYSEFSGRQAAKLGNNLFKQSLYAGAGEVAGTYALRGLNSLAYTGLKHSPKSVKDAIVAAKIVSSKVKIPEKELVPQKSVRYTPKGISTKGAYDASPSNIIKEQNQAFQEGIDEITQMWNGSTDMSNLISSKISSVGPYKLNPDIAQRAKNIGINRFKKHTELTSGDNVPSNYGLYDNLGSNNHIYKGNPEFNKASSKLANANGVMYGDDLSGYSILVKRRNVDGTLKTPQEIKEIAAHEAAHRMQSDYGISLDDPFSSISSTYPKIDESTKLGKVLSKYLKTDDLWARSGNELQANLWKYRVRHNLGTRDLTNDEAIDFFIEFGDKHFKNNTLISNNKELIDAIKAIPVVTGIGVGINNFSNK